MNTCLIRVLTLALSLLLISTSVAKSAATLSIQQKHNTAEGKNGETMLTRLEKEFGRKIRAKLLERVGIIPDLPSRINVEDRDIDFGGLGIPPENLRGNLSIRNIVITGLNTLTDDLRIITDDPCNIRLKFDLGVSKVGITGKYLGDLTLLDSIRIVGGALSGFGTVDIEIIDGIFSLGGTLVVDITNDRASLPDMLLSANVADGSKINLQGLRINGVLTPLIPALLIRTIIKVALPLVKTEVSTIVNEVLSEIPWSIIDPEGGCGNELPIRTTSTPEEGSSPPPGQCNCQIQYHSNGLFCTNVAV